jgi:hypothetical protein
MKILKLSQFLIRENLYLNDDLKVGSMYSESDIYPYIQKIHRNVEDFHDGDISDRIERFQKYIVADIPIDKINMDEYQLDDEYLNDYIEMYKKSGKYPPIVLGYYDNRWGYDIIDGTHRANALRELGFKSIISFVGLNDIQKKVF